MSAKKYTVSVTISEKSIGKGALDPTNRTIRQQRTFHLTKKLTTSKMGALLDGSLAAVNTDLEATGTMFDPGKDTEEGESEE